MYYLLISNLSCCSFQLVLLPFPNFTGSNFFSFLFTGGGVMLIYNFGAKTSFQFSQSWISIATGHSQYIQPTPFLKVYVSSITCSVHATRQHESIGFLFTFLFFVFSGQSTFKCTSHNFILTHFLVFVKAIFGSVRSKLPTRWPSK